MSTEAIAATPRNLFGHKGPSGMVQLQLLKHVAVCHACSNTAISMPRAGALLTCPHQLALCAQSSAAAPAHAQASNSEFQCQQQLP